MSERLLAAFDSMLRVPDRVALVGAGELAILLPETGARQAHAVMERLCEHLAAQRFDRDGVTFETRPGKKGPSDIVLFVDTHGFTSVSLLTTRTALIGRPSSSQASCASTVSEPWPISDAPVISVTAPKSSILRIVPQPSDW